MATKIARLKKQAKVGAAALGHYVPMLAHVEAGRWRGECEHCGARLDLVFRSPDEWSITGRAYETRCAPPKPV